jgi:hypothetical protein
MTRDVTDDGLRWTRAAKGLYLLGVGTFLLLCTLDVLPWSFWRDAVAFWPVLLVAVGIRLIFERSGMAWMVLAGPLLVLGTLMHVARRGPAAPAGLVAWEHLRVERPSGLERFTLEGRLALSTLDLAARPLPRGLLVEGRAAPSGRASLRLMEEGEAARVRVANARRLWTVVIPTRARQRACELRLSQALPVALDLDLALTEGTIDLSSAPVTGVGLDGAFNDLTLRLGAPGAKASVRPGDETRDRAAAPPREDVRLRLEGAFNDIELRVPAGIPVSVASDGFANFVDAREGAAPRQGAGYRVRLIGAFNRLVVEPD